MTSTEPIVEAPPMPAARWLALALGSILLLMAISVGVAYQMDVFGIFRDPRGRALVTSEHERKAKYLLNQAYVPANFNALVIGASASVNWNLQDFAGYRFYNESLEGGDASEQRKLVEEALAKGKFKVALVGLYPRITGLHVLQDGFDSATHGEVLGSISAYSVEYDVLRDKLQHHRSTFTPDGSHPFVEHAPPPYHWHWERAVLGEQDPIAVEDYRALVQELLDRNVRVIYVVNPIFDDALIQNKPVLDAYMASVRATMPAAPMIDLNGPEYTAFRQDQNNFIDVVHLTARGAEKVSQIINDRLQEILKQK